MSGLQRSLHGGFTNRCFFSLSGVFELFKKKKKLFVSMESGKLLAPIRSPHLGGYLASIRLPHKGMYLAPLLQLIRLPH